MVEEVVEVRVPVNVEVVVVELVVSVRLVVVIVMVVVVPRNPVFLGVEVCGKTHFAPRLHPLTPRTGLKGPSSPQDLMTCRNVPSSALVTVVLVRVTVVVVVSSPSVT